MLQGLRMLAGRKHHHLKHFAFELRYRQSILRRGIHIKELLCLRLSRIAQARRDVL